MGAGAPRTGRGTRRTLGPGRPAQAHGQIEDSSNGLRSAGLHVVAIPRPQYPPDPDALAAASLVLPSLAELTTDAISALG